MSVEIQTTLDGQRRKAIVDLKATAADRQFRAAARAEDAASDRVEELIEGIVLDGSLATLSVEQIDELIAALETLKQAGAEMGRAMAVHAKSRSKKGGRS